MMTIPEFFEFNRRLNKERAERAVTKGFGYKEGSSIHDEPAIKRNEEFMKAAMESMNPAKNNNKKEPDPIPNEKTPIVDLVLADLTVRSLLGKKKYGTLLQAHNGRDALVDAYQEAMDLCMYLRQALAEKYM